MFLISSFWCTRCQFLRAYHIISDEFHRLSPAVQISSCYQQFRWDVPGQLLATIKESGTLLDVGSQTNTAIPRLYMNDRLTLLWATVFCIPGQSQQYADYLDQACSSVVRIGQAMWGAEGTELSTPIARRWRRQGGREWGGVSSCPAD